MSQGPGWWQASDGRWYPPASHPGYGVPGPPTAWGTGQSPSGYFPGPVPSALPATSGLAIAALVLSVLWLGGLGSLIGIILAGVALSQIGGSEGRRQGRGLAMTGLILGVVGVLATAGLFGFAASHSVVTTPPEPSVPVSPSGLSAATLALSDLPLLPGAQAGWTARTFVDPTVFGDQPIAHDFADCLGLQSTLLGAYGPGGRAASPVFTSGFYTIENLVAVEPSVATATEVVRQMNGIKASACINRQLTAGWRQFGNASGAGPSGNDFFVNVGSIALGRAGDQSTAFSFFFNNTLLPQASLYEDVVIVRQGQKDAMVTFFGIGEPVDVTFERHLEAVMATHLRSLVLKQGQTKNELARFDRPVG